MIIFCHILDYFDFDIDLYTFAYCLKQEKRDPKATLKDYYHYRKNCRGEKTRTSDPLHPMQVR